MDLLNIQSNKFKKVCVLGAFMISAELVLMAIFWHIGQSMEDGMEFVAFMAFIGCVVLVFAISLSWSFVPRYVFLFKEDGIQISTNKIFGVNYLSAGERVKKQVGVLGASAIESSLKKQEANGSLDFLFARLKVFTFFVSYNDIVAVNIQPSWHNFLFKTTSVYLVTKNGPIELSYINKEKITQIIGLIENQNIRIQNNIRPFFLTPDFLKNLKS